MALSDQYREFEQRLLALVEESAALECVNQLLMLKCQEDMYATLDVLLLDLSTCRARFLKQGAPPSYILRKGRVYTIHAETLPVGILVNIVFVLFWRAGLKRYSSAGG